MTGSEPSRAGGSRDARGTAPIRGVPAVLTAALLSLATAACTAPAPSTSSYRDHAEQTVSDLLSAVRTGVLVADLAEEDRAFAPYLDVNTSGAEDSARSISDTFGVLQPPAPDSDELRETLTGLCDTAVGDLSDLRVALRRDDAEGVAEAAEGLRGTASELTALQEELR